MPVPVPVPVLVAVAQPPQVGSHEAGFVHQVQPLPEHVLWVVPIHDPDPAEIEQHAPGGGGGGLEHMGETSSPVFSSMVPGAPPHPFGVPIEIAPITITKATKPAVPTPRTHLDVFLSSSFGDIQIPPFMLDYTSWKCTS